MAVVQVLAEVGDQADLPFVSEITENFQQEFTQVLAVDKFTHLARPEPVREGKFRTRDQPVGKMVPFGVKHQRIDIDPCNTLLHFLEPACPVQFRTIGQLEYKVTKTKIPVDKYAELVQQLGRCLVQETGVTGEGLFRPGLV